MKQREASGRKSDHIELAFSSQVDQINIDERFYYEPMLSPHPGNLKKIPFIGKELAAPIWVSSMTGGTEKARKINHTLAKICNTFGMGMGLGSCRSLLDADDHLDDFNVRPIIGKSLPLYANLGIAQVETLIASKQTHKIISLINKLDADGLIIHVNPLQEWLQPEGDLIKVAPIHTIQQFIALHPDVSLIVKEVGQGIGPDSLRALMQLPLAAIEFAAHGGTNFSKLELLRNGDNEQQHFTEVSLLGHSAGEMVDMINDILSHPGDQPIRCRSFIISGGVKSFLDGYYLTQKLHATAVYGQASALLKHAENSYEDTYEFVKYQLKGYAMAEAYLRIRK